MTASSRLRALAEGLHEFYVGPYRRTFARAQRDEDDLFRMLVMSEMLGVPNPASYYTAELLPVLYDGFHDRVDVRLGYRPLRTSDRNAS